MKSRLYPLEFDLWRTLRPYRGEHFLVAVSGGLDSIVLLRSLAAVKAKLGLRLTVAHAHHGYSRKVEVRQWRDRAHAFVESVARELGLPFVSRRRPGRFDVSGEAELRDWRWSVLNELRRECGADWVLLGHHRDDLFETRLIRLIRGTGPEGLRAMSVRSGRKLRPFLGTARDRLFQYAREREVAWLDDPTNASSSPLRNWLRLEWLPALDKKRPGAKDALARSLQLLAERLSGESGANAYARLGNLCLSESGIDRGAYTPLPVSKRRFVLSLYLKNLKARGIGHTQISEIAKRLDTDQKSLTFKVGSFTWVVNAEQIRAIPTSTMGSHDEAAR